MERYLIVWMFDSFDVLMFRVPYSSSRLNAYRTVPRYFVWLIYIALLILVARTILPTLLRNHLN